MDNTKLGNLILQSKDLIQEMRDLMADQRSKKYHGISELKHIIVTCQIWKEYYSILAHKKANRETAFRSFLFLGLLGSLPMLVYTSMLHFLIYLGSISVLFSFSLFSGTSELWGMVSKWDEAQIKFHAHLEEVRAGKEFRLEEMKEIHEKLLTFEKKYIRKRNRSLLESCSLTARHKLDRFIKP